MNKYFAHKFKTLLQEIYGEKYHEGDEEQILDLGKKYYSHRERPLLNESDNCLIIYSDAISDGMKPTLAVLDNFIRDNINFINNLHILPMFEYTSDDGYAVTDYLKIRKECGSWDDVEHLSSRYGLILDLVINHVSSQSPWLKKYLDGEEAYRDFFIEYKEDFDFSCVVRPRDSDLFHEYEGKAGKKKLWTTFSEDQVDLNYANYQVLLKVLGIIGEYLKHGARGIRLDAVCYLWKESGKSCCNLEKTHKVIQLIRAFMEMTAPGSVLLSQTNVTADENMKYFGDGSNEAGLIYQFALPPLVLYSILSGNAEKLSAWASEIKRESDTATYFNFLGGHDGIGLRPVSKILSDEDITLLAENTEAEHGKVSWSVKPDGSPEPYELNISYLSALTQSEDTDEVRIRKMLAAHAIMCSLAGIPALYYHGVFGSENDLEGMKKSGIVRRINRQKFEASELCGELSDTLLRKGILSGIRRMLEVRAKNRAFDPYGFQKILSIGAEIFAVERWSQNGGKHILAVINVSRRCQTIEFKGKNYTDILTGRHFENQIEMQGYEYLWLSGTFE